MWEGGTKGGRGGGWEGGEGGGGVVNVVCATVGHSVSEARQA